MIRPIMFTLVIVVAIACGRLIGSSDKGAPHRATLAAAECACDCPAVAAEITDDTDEEEAAIAACEAKLAELKQSGKPRVKTQIKTQIRKCAGEAPKIRPVASEKCAEGKLCLDEHNQAILLANIAEYESWVAGVLKCEEGD